MSTVFPNEVPFAPLLIIIYLYIIKRFEIYMALYVYRRATHGFNIRYFLNGLDLYINYYICIVPISLIISVVLYLSKESFSYYSSTWKLIFFMSFSMALYVSYIYKFNFYIFILSNNLIINLIIIFRFIIF
jgi:hypothetical protein